MTHIRIKNLKKNIRKMCACVCVSCYRTRQSEDGWG